MATANTTRNNHIFPLFLKGAAVTLTESNDGAIPITTSYVKFDIGGGGTNSFTLADGNVPGQIMVLWAEDADSTNTAVITVATTVFAENDVITLNADDELVTLMWNGEAWCPLSGGGVGTWA
jgi:hypothetical protein